MTNPEEAAAKIEDPAHPVDASKSSEVVIRYLKDNNLSFFHTSHPIAYTAQQAAAEAHVPGNEFGKAVMVQLDDKEIVMCVLRAPDRVLLTPFAKAINATKAELCSDAKIKEMSGNVKGMEAGALPPLPIFGVRMFMDTELAKAQLIHFCAGSHHEIITMYMQDYVKVAKPTILTFAEPLDIHVRELTKLLQKFKLGMPHGILRHKPAYTASEAAKETSVPGAAMVKSVVVKLDGRLGLCAVCSTDVIDFQKLARLAQAEMAELASEEQLKEHFQGVEVGAIPPFGCLFNVPLYVDEGVGSWPIKGDGDVIFNAGTHTESMIMRYYDYLNVNRKWNEPVVGKFAHLDTGAGHPWTSSHIKRYLHDQEIGFTSVMHSVAYTASEIAHAAGISGNFLAKTVMVKVDGNLAMAVLRAADFVDLDKLSQLVGGKSVALAEEPEFANIFSHVEPGAMPPFGQIYNMPTYVDVKLAGMDHLYMNAGTHKELLCLKWSDYNRMVSPVIGDLARVPAPSTPAPTPASGSASPQPGEVPQAKPDTTPNSAETKMPQAAASAAPPDVTVSVSTAPVDTKHADPAVAKAADTPPTSHAT